MEEISMNKTIENLLEGFAGESQATRKYMIYAEKAEKEGLINAAKLFKAAALAEEIHAKSHLQAAGKIGTTAENLQDAVNGETYEFESKYPKFIEEADPENDKAAIRSFTYAMEAEKVHAELYKEALENIEESEEVFYYLCPVCGNIEKFVPDKCSICNVDGAKFIKF